ncbi:MAG: efflux RND transporter permease subunit, partial [Acidobacteria bacterium]|nr:efflux RND transporter permease subunit [Acidobacteriota bacterium]
MLLNGLIRWSLRNRLVVLAAAGAFLVWGGSVASRMPVDVLPDLTAPTVTVLVEARGMAPRDMEALVTFPIEAVINGASGVRRVRSATAVGIAVIWVDFDWDADVYRARQTVTEKLATVAQTLPDNASAPVLAPLSSIMGEIMFVALEPDAPAAAGAAPPTPLDLRTTADTIVRRRLLAVPGVSQVTVIGGERRQFEVLVNPERLDAYRVSLSDLEAALQRASRNTSAGFRHAGGNEYLIQGAGRALGVDGIGATVIATRGTLPIRVQDVADLRIGESIKRGDGSHNGNPAVILGIHRQPDVNTLALTGELDGVLERLQSELPAGMRLNARLFRQADFIELALGNLTEALRDGTLLVIVVTLLFLANLRAGAITLLAIPLSLLAAVVGLRMAGLSINSMTLGGMAIAVGALVDDAVVDVENVTRRLRENAALPAAERRPVLEVVYRGSCEIRASIAFATFVVMLVFLPLFFLPGVEGRLLQPLGLAYLIALFASLVVALTVTPALCLSLLPGARLIREAREPALAAACKRIYARLLPGVLRRPWLVIGAAALLLAGALATVPRMGRAFLPAFNEGALVISAVTLPGTSLAESNALGSAVERLLLDVPEVDATSRRTGRAELDEHVQGVESAEIDVRLLPGGRPRAVVLEEIRERLSLVPGTNITIGQPISHRIDHMLSGTRANIAVKIFGDDLVVLRGGGRPAGGAPRGGPGPGAPPPGAPGGHPSPPRTRDRG